MGTRLVLFDQFRTLMNIDDDEFNEVLERYTDIINNTGPDGYNNTDNCLRVFKLIELFQDSYLPKIKANAIRQKILNGDDLKPGFITPGIAIKPDVGSLSIRQYFKHFCDNDPLVYNHNGGTNISTIDTGTNLPVVDAANDLQLAPQDIPAFIDYFTAATSTQPQLMDALRYIWNPDEQDEVCYKYKMPSVLFTVNPGTNVLQIRVAPAAAGRTVTGPSTADNRFSADGGVMTNTNVFPGGKDYINLTQIGLLRGSALRGLWTTKLPYNSFFTFPNFLLGEMLYMSMDPMTRRPRDPATFVFRPFSSSQNDLEFWVKNYKTGDASFPYDTKRYVLPEGWKMIERADGIIMYLSPENVLYSDPPDGSYYIKKSDQDINTVIKSTPAYVAMVNAVNLAINNGHCAGGPAGPYSAVDMGTSTVQNKLKLVAYMTNIEYRKTHGIITGTGGNKKKTKRKNIIKHVAKSKKKHNHK